MTRAWLKWPVAAVLALAFLFLAFNLYVAGQALWAVCLLLLAGAGFFVYLGDIAFAYRYLFPGIAGMVLFVAFPLLYTVQIGFTNYSSSNLLGEDRARAYLLDQADIDDEHTLQFSLHPDGREYRLLLTPLHEPADETNPARWSALLERGYISPRLALRASQPPAVTPMLPLAQGSFQVNSPLSLREVLQHREVLQQLKLRLPDDTVLSYAGVREFGPRHPLWTEGTGGALTEVATGTVYRPDRRTGFFTDAAGHRLQPGFTVNIGFANYLRMFTNANFRGPFLQIFVWTVAFAALTVLFSLIIGMTLAVMLNWEALRFRTAYRTLLFLPYAVPGFISILVFKGLFNQNFGEINGILNALFGIRPTWFADPTLAKVMILIVNTWLGYPFVMVLCAGLIKSVPADLYEASAIAGAGPFTNFFRITAPLIIRPLTPLLISAFAYNFNNFVLISLLTDGRPDFLNTKLPAGTTDILVSYTYRIAFADSGQNFGLAAAISTLIFIIVALLSLANLKLAKVNRDIR